MYGILVSALYTIIRWLVGGAAGRLILAGIFTLALSIITSMLAWYLTGMPTGSALLSLFTALPASIKFFLDYVNLSYGLPLIINAMIARFVIGLIPVIGAK